MSDSDRVLRTAALARLAVPPEHADALARDFDRMLAAFAELSELELERAARSRAPTEQAPLREDAPRSSVEREHLLDNAPDATDGFYGVPKTIDQND